MFEELFEAEVKAVMPRRIGETDDLWIELRLQMPLDDGQVEDLGPSVKALIGAREQNGRVLPFEQATLALAYDDLRFTLFDPNKGAQFEIGGCQARKLQLVQDPNDPRRALFRWVVLIPVARKQYRDQLVTALGRVITASLDMQQLDLPVNVATNGR